MIKVKTGLAAVGFTLALAGAAAAGGFDHHGGRGAERRAERDYRAFSPGRPAGDVGPGRRRGPEADFGPRGYGRREYSPYASVYAPPRTARAYGRGEFLPRPYLGSEVVDLRRYRLRTPPPGYGWYGVGRDAYLVQRSTGLVLDTAPSAW